MTASFRINQDGIDGYADRARRDIQLSAVSGDVSFEALDLGHTTYLWELISAPPDTDKTLTNPTQTTATFEVVNTGGFLIRLTVDAGLVTEDTKVLYFGVPLENSGLLLPAQGEVDFDNSQAPYDGVNGLHEKLHAIYAWVDVNAGGGGGGTLDAAYDYGGAGAGRTINVDSGAVTLTVPNTANNTCLDLIQNDTTNGGATLRVANNYTSSEPLDVNGWAINLNGSNPLGNFIGSTGNILLISNGTTVGTYTFSAASLSCGSFSLGSTSQNEISSYSAVDDSTVSIVAYSDGATTDARVNIYASELTTGTPYRDIQIGRDVGTDASKERIRIYSGGGRYSSPNNISGWTAYTDLFFDARDAFLVTALDEIYMVAGNSVPSGDQYFQIRAQKTNTAGTGNAYVSIGATAGDGTSTGVGTVRLYDSGNSGSTWTQTYVNLTDGSTAEWDQFEADFGEVSIFNALSQAYASGGGGGGTLDSAYDYGGSGAGRTITADSGTVQVTVPDTSSNAALSLTQNDVTNNPATLVITNDATTSMPTTPGSTGASLYLTSTSSKAQTIWSDQELYIGSNHDDGAIRMYGKTSTGNALVDILSTSSSGQGFLSLAASSFTDDGVVEISAYGVSNIVKSSVTISANNNGSGDGELLLKARSASGNARIVIGDTYTQSIRFADKNLDDATWTATYVPLSASSTQWNTYKSNFGETSIVDAVNQAYAAGGGGTLQDWGYLSTTGPTGAASPSLVYQFDGSADQLDDRTGGGVDLTVNTGVRNVPLSAIGDTWSIRNLTDDDYSPYTTNLTEALRAVGAITVECVCYIQGYSSGEYIFVCSATGEALTSNYLYSLKIDSAAGKAVMFVEYGAGVNVEIDPLVHHSQCIPVYIAMTRASDGVSYKLYFNSILVGSVTASHAPEKDVSGNLQQLYLMRDSAAGNEPNMGMSSFRITLEEFTQSQIEEVWAEIKPQVV